MHLVGSCTGLLSIHNGRIQYRPDKANHPFDVPLSSIKYGTVRIGADFYLELPNGKSYLFKGPTPAVFQAIAQAAGTH